MTSRVRGAPDRRSQEDHRDDVAAAAEEVWGDALVLAAVGAASEDQQHDVAKAWREVGVAPWRVETFKFSTDPELVAKVTDIVGLYLARAERDRVVHR